MTDLNLAFDAGEGGADEALFRAAASHLAAGVAVVTTRDAAGRPHGLTVTSLTSLSLEPLQFLVCIDNRAASLAALEQSRIFCISLLARGQEALARLFARRDAEKFGNPAAFSVLPSGLHAVRGAIAHISCRVGALYDGGDHRIVTGLVEGIDLFGGEPLVHHRGAFRSLA